MKLRHVILAFAIIVALGLPQLHVAAEDASPTGDTENATPTKSESETEDDWLTKLVDTYYDAVDSYNNQVIERNLAVSEASGAREEWNPPDSEDLSRESWGLRYIRKFEEYDEYYRINDAIAKDPGLQKLIDDGLKNMAVLRGQHVKDSDPRWQKLDALVKGKIDQQSKAKKESEEWRKKRDTFDKKLQDYRNKWGSYPPHACSPAPLWHRSPGVTCTDQAKKGSTDTHGHSDGHGH